MTVHKYERSIIANVNDLVELERVTAKTLLVKSAIGLLPGLRDGEINRIHNILEIGCGPGAWTVEMAQAYYHQDLQILGIDTSRNMICYANSQAQDRHLQKRVHHCQVDSLAGPFALPDASFDLISAQFLSKALFKNDWPILLGECLRLLRPGGQLCVTDYEVGESNAPAHEEMSRLFIQAMRLAGRSFSPGDRHLGLLCELEPMLVIAGFGATQCNSHVINYSKGAAMHQEWKRDFLIFSKSIQPFLIKMGVVTQEQLDQLYLQLQMEMNLQAFHGMLSMLTVWGTRLMTDSRVSGLRISMGRTKIQE